SRLARNGLLTHSLGKTRQQMAGPRFLLGGGEKPGGPAGGEASSVGGDGAERSVRQRRGLLPDCDHSDRPGPIVKGSQTLFPGSCADHLHHIVFMHVAELGIVEAHVSAKRNPEIGAFRDRDQVERLGPPVRYQQRPVFLIYLEDAAIDKDATLIALGLACEGQLTCSKHEQGGQHYRSLQEMFHCPTLLSRTAAV